MSHRPSAFPTHARTASTSTGPTSSSHHHHHTTSASSGPAGAMHHQQHNQQHNQHNQQQQKNAQRTRQYAHLHAALAQLNAHLADTENLLRMTAVQAEYVRGLGGWTGGLFMAAARVLGEEATATKTAEAEAGTERDG